LDQARLAKDMLAAQLAPGTSDTDKIAAVRLEPVLTGEVCGQQIKGLTLLGSVLFVSLIASADIATFILARGSVLNRTI
jgi:hypothetical protein